MSSVETVSKSEFARQRGVSAARVSQWIRDSKIGPEALDGEGRMARIRVPVALEHLRDRLDPSQRFGMNGVTTDLNGPPAAAEPDKPAPLVDPFDAQIKAQKLRQAELQTQRLEEEQRTRTGIYIRTEDAQIQMQRLAVDIMKVFEGSITDLATALAGRFELPQRDVVHFLKTEFRTIRDKAAKSAAIEAERVPETIEDPTDKPADQVTAVAMQ
jgi:hypothetical protein